LPRRFQPPARRRKAKRQRSSSLLEEPLVPYGIDEAPTASAPVAAPPAPAARAEPRQQHLLRDHRYVLHEIRRIAVIGGFITAGLVVTAILR